MKSAGVLHDENRLIERVARGDVKAFETLYDRYSAMVYSLAARMLGQSIAEEMVQEVFILVWRKAQLYEPKRGVFSTWLMRVAHHRIIDELRRRRRQTQPISENAERPMEDLADMRPLTEQIMAQEARGAAVRAALSKLSLEQQAVIEQAYFKGLTQSDIAEKLQIPLGTVKTRIRLGLQKLRGELTQKGVFKV